MNISDAVLLGLLQALGEFLPISSSAHLVLLPYFSGQAYQGLAFDVMLHVATLLAVLIYFGKDWFYLIKDGLTRPASKEGRVIWYLALGTVPAGLAGLTLGDWAETTFRNPLMIAACLMIFAVILWLADRKAGGQTGNELTLKTVLFIGCAQALAIMPGVSRSGVTITAALLLGLSRSASARVSFLLSAPVIGGAAVLELHNLSAGDLNAPFICGFLSAFLGALLVIGFLMKYIKTHTFNVFVIYRLLLGMFIIGFYIWK